MRWQKGRETLDRWWDQWLDLIYPPICVWCTRACPSAEQRLCDACRDRFTDQDPICPVCARTLVVPSDRAWAPPQLPCPHCQVERSRFRAIVRLARYGGDLRAAILRLKRTKDSALCMALAHLLVDRNPEQLDSQLIDVVIPMPTHWTRRLWRGVDNLYQVAKNDRRAT